MSRKIVDINDNSNDVEIVSNQKKVEVIHTDCPDIIEVTHPVTSVIEVLTPGPRGPIGPAGEDVEPNLIYTGSVTASVDVSDEIFLITSASIDYFSISPSSSYLKSDVFLIKDTLDTELLKISESIYYFNTHSVTPSTNPVPGAIYFTSSSMFIGLE